MFHGSMNWACWKFWSIKEAAQRQGSTKQVLDTVRTERGTLLVPRWFLCTNGNNIFETSKALS